MKMKKITFIIMIAFIGESLITNAQTYTIYTIAGNGLATYSGDGGPATTAGIFNPEDLACDNLGNTYFSDPGNNRIRKIDNNGIISTIAGTGTAGYSGDGSAATSAQINNPIGIVIDTIGNIYFVDYGNNCVRKINSNGVINTIAGTGSFGFSGDGGPAIAASLYQPQGIALDNLGNVFIADVSNVRIRKVDTSGIITTVAGNGSFGFSGDGGDATLAQLSEKPYAVEADHSGNLFIADTYNHRIRKVNANGIISTIAGDGTAGFSGDGGAATSAQLNNPSNISIDTIGNLYVTDGANNRIRKINTNGIISTIAGNGIAGFSGDSGVAISASITPKGTVVSRSGKIYIADIANNRIRELISCGASFIQQPQNATVFTTHNGIFVVSTSALAPTYQWQVNMGTGWVNLNNAGTYNGTNSDSLQINGAIIGMNNYHFRCVIVYNSSCSDTTNDAILTVLLNTGLHPILLLGSINIYPNPAQDELTIELNSNMSDDLRIELNNTLGKRIQSEQISGRAKILISLKNIDTGIYFLRISNQTESILRRIVVSK